MPPIIPTRRAALLAVLILILGACAKAPAPVERSCPPAQCPACPACPVCPVCPAVPPAATAPAAASLQPAGWEALTGWQADALLPALPALRQSCVKLGAAKPWQPFCARLEQLGTSPAEGALRALLTDALTPWKVVNADGSEEGLVTGYYEPLIRGRRERSDDARWPILGVPDDLVSVDLAEIYPELKKLRLRGRLAGNRLEPYWTRGEIEARQHELPARVLLWAEDPIELFFLQVQGSGRVELPDGRRVRVGYADQNGHPYESIGRWLVEQGELSLSQASMAGIKGWAQANPERLSELLNVNPSYVFFRELPVSDAGPIGALGVPLTEGRSIAVDPTAIPLGSPVFIATEMPNSDQPLRRLVVAQDTGGAIKGAVRADFFWGFGTEAGLFAGRMRQKGRLWVLLPKGFAPNGGAGTS